MERKVDLIHGGWLNAPNGASSVLKSFYVNRKLFLQYGIDISFYTLDKPGDKFDISNCPYRSSFRNKIKSMLIKSSRSNAFIHCSLTFM